MPISSESGRSLRGAPLQALLARWIGVVRGGSGDRALERQRRVLLTAAASALAKGISVLTMLVSVPLTLHYLGDERYGMWITISAFTAMLSFADLGIGNGLLTAVARASGRDDMRDVRVYISSATVVLASIAALIALVSWSTFPFVNWASVFNVHGYQARQEAGPAMLVFLSCFALSLPVTVIQRVQMGLQRGFLSSIWQCAASLVTLGGVLVAVALKGSLPWLVGAYSGPTLIIGVANSLVFFRFQMPEVAPAGRYVSRQHGLEVMRTGALFFVLQVTVAVAYLSDSFVISRTLGAAYVTQYSIADRMFAVISLLIGFVVMPLWPAFGEALARNDRDWAWRTLMRGTVSAFVVAAGIATVLVIAAPEIIRLWVGNGVKVPFALLLGMAAWRVVEATANTPSMYLNALQAVKFQVVIAVCTGAAALTLKLLLIDGQGVEILPWITVGCYLAFAALPTVIFFRRHGRAPVDQVRP